MCSPDGHWRRCRFRWLVAHPSTFLRPFAPRRLPALPRSYGRSDSCSGGSSARGSMNTVCGPQQVSLCHVPGLHGHSVSTHLRSSARRFRTLPLSPGGFLRVQVWTSSLPRRLVRFRRPYRVRYPTDWSCASDCSPPRLAAAQLSSASGRRAYAWRGLAPLGSWHTYRRTRPGLQTRRSRSSRALKTAGSTRRARTPSFRWR